MYLLVACAKPYRQLSQAEIDYLTEHGNVAEDWGKVLVINERESESTLLPFRSNEPPRVVRCYFFGTVMLCGNFVGDIDGEPCGLYDSTLIDCVVAGMSVLIEREPTPGQRRNS